MLALPQKLAQSYAEKPVFCASMGVVNREKLHIWAMTLLIVCSAIGCQSVPPTPATTTFHYLSSITIPPAMRPQDTAWVGSSLLRSNLQMLIEQAQLTTVSSITPASIQLTATTLVSTPFAPIKTAQVFIMAKNLPTVALGVAAAPTDSSNFMSFYPIRTELLPYLQQDTFWLPVRLIFADSTTVPTDCELFLKTRVRGERQ